MKELLLRSLCFLLKLIFVSVDLDNEDYGKPVAEYFGVSGNGPKVSLLFLFCYVFKSCTFKRI